MRLIGHRGDAANHPENTLDAFEAAIAAGVHGIEFDVRMTADGALVVMHDDDVTRTTDGTGLISAMKLDDVLALRSGSAHVPTLDDVLSTIAGRTTLIVEMKIAPHGDSFTGVHILEAAAPALRAHEGIVIDSFDPRVLDAAVELVPDAPRFLASMRVSGDDWMIAMALDKGYDAIMTPYDQIDPDFVGEVHGAGCELLCWSVPPNEAAAAARAGLDGALVFDPGAARDALARG